MTTPKKLHARTRRPRIAQHYLQNTPLAEIATHFHVTLATVKNDLQTYFENQDQNAHLPAQEQLAIEIATLNRVERQSWQAYKNDTQAYRFLRIVLECAKQRTLLLKLQDQTALPPTNQEIINTIQIIREKTNPTRK